MKIIKSLSLEEIGIELPQGLLDALNATDPTNVIYCDRCDGLRLRVHDCKCWHCKSPTCEKLACLKNPKTKSYE